MERQGLMQGPGTIAAKWLREAGQSTPLERLRGFYLNI
jgi:hypothetical protein